MKKYYNFFTVALLVIFLGILTPTYGQWQKYIIEDNPITLKTLCSVELADLDSDTKLDLLVTNSGRSQIILYLNDFPQWNKNIIDNARATFA